MLLKSLSWHLARLQIITDQTDICYPKHMLQRNFHVSCNCCGKTSRNGLGSALGTEIWNLSGSKCSKKTGISVHERTLVAPSCCRQGRWRLQNIPKQDHASSAAHITAVHSCLPADTKHLIYYWVKRIYYWVKPRSTHLSVTTLP